MAIQISKKNGKVQAHADVHGYVSTKSDHGGETKESVKVGSVVQAPIMANVGMHASRTVNLGDYNSVKIEVSLFMPCEIDKKAIDKTYEFVSGWVSEKMVEITDSLKGD